MKLRHEFAADGTLWYENPFPRVSDQFTRLLLGIVLVSLLGPAWVVLRLAFTADRGVSTLDLFLVLAPPVILYEYWRRRRNRAWGMPDASTPRRVGFRSSELVWGDARGNETRVPWNRVQSIETALRPGLNVTMHVRTGGGELVLTNVNLDLLIKARWALGLSWRNSLDLARLAAGWEPTYPRTAPPPADAIEIASEPPLFLLPDLAILWRRARGQELPRGEVAAIPLWLLGANRCLVTFRDRQVAVINHIGDAAPLIEWLGTPPLPSFSPPGKPAAQPVR